ncbi:MAG: hypothetical protein LBF12_02445 [Christensenellaceae bacterium]|nr:hypothetical protein [Christensenellaceae bacterium]
MIIDHLLEYQKIENNLHQARNVVLGSDKERLLNNLKLKEIELKKNIDSEEATATDCFDRIIAITKYIGMSPKHAALNVENLTYENLTKLESDISAHKTHLERLKKDFENTTSKLSQLTENHTHECQELIKTRNLRTSKMEDYKKIAKEFNDDNASELQKMNSIGSKLPRELLVLYIEKSKSKVKRPFVVKYINGSCGGCGHDIKAEVDDKLKKPDDYAECPNCMRIVYNK